MALIVCTECGKRVSEYARFCPGCGCPGEIIRKKGINQNDSIMVDNIASDNKANKKKDEKCQIGTSGAQIRQFSDYYKRSESNDNEEINEKNSYVIDALLKAFVETSSFSKYDNNSTINDKEITVETHEEIVVLEQDDCNVSILDVEFDNVLKFITIEFCSWPSFGCEYEEINISLENLRVNNSLYCQNDTVNKYLHFTDNFCTLAIGGINLILPGEDEPVEYDDIKSIEVDITVHNKQGMNITNKKSVRFIIDTAKEEFGIESN